ncbi:hypothetical protein J7T55_004967 [Diaporthe amygdali]|uniref:uncharacterized protein n=1 Tax=Phomopsis amygdali TaxID=1214568 RepID=UPI0022FE0326|nr:uncharacterized protein J7T55_004967 [Diaporthe amygdali]KAJ0114723.1 hypothetical protein J7T55_004967 [Diaporthe amygdali]
MAQPQEDSFTRFKQLPVEIRDIIWSGAWANRKPEICTHLNARSPTNDLPGFPPTQLTVDIDLALMHACKESRAFLTSTAGGVRFRYSLASKHNVPCRAFDPALDTLYLGWHNWDEAMWKNEYLGWHSRNDPNTLPTLPDNEFTETWQQVQNITLQPGLFVPGMRFAPRFTWICNGLLETFPKLERISVVVNPFVPLESSVMGEICVGVPNRRCRLVEVSGDTTFPGKQPYQHWADDMREVLKDTREPDHTIPLQIQNFEVYVGRRGRMQWKKHPLNSMVPHR